jgi:hypothetical protein
MGKCHREGCEVEISRGKWCSDRCRKAHSRVKVGQNPDTLKVGQPKSDRYPVLDSSPIVGPAGIEPLAQELILFDFLPSLPDDEVIACNSEIGWSDILKMSMSQIDYVYREWKKMGDSILLRLRRAGGYFRRVNV